MRSGVSIVTADQARGRATGALFFIGFGVVWLLLGLGAMPGSHGWAQALVCAVGAVLVILALDLMRRAKALPAAARNAEAEERSRRIFRAANIIQWVSIATAVAILNILRMPEYAVTAIAIIVGLHLFPLAGSFQYRQHYVTGGLLVLWPLVCLTMLPRSQVSGVTALGAGLVLLASAAATLLRNAGVWRSHGGAMRAIAERT